MSMVGVMVLVELSGSNPMILRVLAQTSSRSTFAIGVVRFRRFTLTGGGIVSAEGQRKAGVSSEGSVIAWGSPVCWGSIEYARVRPRNITISANNGTGDSKTRIYIKLC